VFELIYGTTPASEWVTIDASVAGQVRTALRAAGGSVAATGGWDDELEAALAAWVFDANLDGRWSGGDRIDPVVLEQLLASG
jgi:hypothetical protein